MSHHDFIVELGECSAEETALERVILGIFAAGSVILITAFAAISLGFLGALLTVVFMIVVRVSLEYASAEEEFDFSWLDN